MGNGGWGMGDVEPVNKGRRLAFEEITRAL
jgi:hypothetical protein